MPAFLAGKQLLTLGKIDELIRYHQKQRGNSPMLETCLELLQECIAQTKELQQLARCITDRDYAAELLGREDAEEREFERLGAEELARGGTFTLYRRGNVSGRR